MRRLFVSISLVLFPLGLFAANRNSEIDLKRQLDTLSLRLSNQEAELKMLEERLHNQCETTDDLQQQFSSLQSKQKDSLSEQFTQVRQTTLELVRDMKTLKDHVVELSSSLKSQNQRIVQLESNLTHMKGALESVLTILDPKDQSQESSQIYVVKKGDSLERIAKNQRTTIQAIKEINQLKNDQIVIGQKLQIPNR